MPAGPVVGEARSEDKLSRCLLRVSRVCERFLKREGGRERERERERAGEGEREGERRGGD